MTDDRYPEMLARLDATQRRLDALDAERSSLVDDLDDTIELLRTAGCPWTLINETCGTANMQVSFDRRRRVRNT